MSPNVRACSIEKLKSPILPPRSTPLLSASWRVFWFSLDSTMKGDFPLRVFTFTMPLLRSPYSTDGTPVTTSTLSILAVLRVRVPAPSVSPGVALLSSRTPSTSMAVPNEALPISPLLLRRAIRVSRSNELFHVLPPGRRLMMSPRFKACRLSSAKRSMV